MRAERTRLEDIARVTGVSVSTVSRALRSDPRIAEKTRWRVATEARRLNYHKPGENGIGRRAGLEGSTSLVARLVPRLERLRVLVMRPDPRAFFAETLVELVQQGQECGFAVDVQEGRDENLARHLTEAEAGGANAVLVLTFGHLTEAHGRLFQDSPVPVVLINRHVEGMTNAVTLDDFAAGVQAARYLVGLGHRRIAHLPGPQGASSMRERAAGFRTGLETVGCFDPALFVEPVQGDVLKWAQASVGRLLALPEPPTAIWAHHDLAAGATVVAVRAAGLRVPEDISIMGFDRKPELRETRLTTFDYRFRELARQSLRLIEGLLAGTVRGPVRVCVVPALVQGETTGPAPERPSSPIEAGSAGIDR